MACDPAFASEQTAQRATHGQKGFGSLTTYCNRLVRSHKAGVFDRILKAITEAYDGEVQMIDSTKVQVHQHTANVAK